MVLKIGKRHHEPVGLFQSVQLTQENVAQVTSLFCNDFDRFHGILMSPGELLCRFVKVYCIR